MPKSTALAVDPLKWAKEDTLGTAMLKLGLAREAIENAQHGGEVARVLASTMSSLGRSITFNHGLIAFDAKDEATLNRVTTAAYYEICQSSGALAPFARTNENIESACGHNFERCKHVLGNREAAIECIANRQAVELLLLAATAAAIEPTGTNIANLCTEILACTGTLEVNQ